MPDSTSEVNAPALLAAAREVRRFSHSPYSRFAVGAALLDEHGEIHVGVNVENASYGLTICAERSAVVTAVGRGKRAFRAIAIAGPVDGEPCLPCGACRQVLWEFAPELLVVVADGGSGTRSFPLRELLPEPFGIDPGPGGRGGWNERVP